MKELSSLRASARKSGDSSLSNTKPWFTLRSGPGLSFVQNINGAARSVLFVQNMDGGNYNIFYSLCGPTFERS